MGKENELVNATRCEPILPIAERKQTKSELIVQLADEHLMIDYKLKNLRDFLDYKQPCVTEHHKRLLQMQEKAMDAYCDVLRARMLDIITSFHEKEVKPMPCGTKKPTKKTKPTKKK